MQRYGKPVKDANQELFPLLRGAALASYNYQGFRIKVAFLNGVAVRQKYVRIELINGSLRMSDVEVQAILDAEKGSGEWQGASPTRTSSDLLTKLYTRLMKPLLGTQWERSTDHATANLEPARQSILLDTPAALQAEATFKKATEEGKGQKVPKF